ncbi:fibrinogen-like protein 1 [Liolophura sinensis]|uniref:fibrinogen-like protein 1 n=1 Tax=Liolophura sinensis TaxID=3198878 RepID=UPI0031584E25
MDELQRQNQENILLKEEVEGLKLKHKEQKLLLTQLTSTMGELVKKIKLGQRSCTCSTPQEEHHTVHVLSEKAAEIEPPDSAPSTSSTLENVQTSPISNTAVSPEANSKPDKLVQTSQVSVTPAGVPSTLTTPEQVKTSRTPLTTGVPQVMHSQDSLQTTDTTSEDETVTEQGVSSGYVAVYPRDCQDLMSSKPMFSGQYTIFPVNASKPFRVYCQVEEGAAWTVIQRRDGGMVDFYRDWSDYKAGFGRLTDEFWIGNEHLHQLTRQATYKLKIDMWDWAGEYYYAESNFVYVSGESEYYTLYAPDNYYAYSGFGGSGLRVHRGSFMTFDHQDPSMISDNCAQKFHCGWWFTTCVRNANLNGRYYSGGYENISTKSRNIDDIYWHSVEQSLKKVVMRLYRTQDMPKRVKGYR